MLYVKVLAATLVAVAAATPPSIFLGSTTLRLGMLKSTVLSLLGDDAKLTKVNDSDDQWVVVGKSSGDTCCDMLSFTNDKLSWISKDWGSVDEGSLEFCNALFGLMENITLEESGKAVISTSTRHSPGIDYKSITIEFENGKSVLINIPSNLQKGKGSIQEMLK